ncbi:MAG TPA: hypothetical protein VLA09_11490, partial [Longimicrobiales bacterium]|nr:hypothetical protein [Longimicrobiales bacterium]
PFEARGVTPPSACWMADSEVADRIRTVSFALVPRGIQIERAVVGDQAADAPVEEPTAERSAILADLDAAALAQDLDAWVDAADRFLADLSDAERARSRAMLRVLTNAQMSSGDREAAPGN